jgi:hypothetical protein
MAALGTDYVLTGDRWADSHITFSFAPDGVTWGSSVNNLNAVFDAKFGAGNWERQMARALATWESVAAINFSQVADSPLPEGVSGREQGDPRFGDIRFGGYTFVNDTTTLAQTYFPSPGGSTIEGDVEINTAMGFNIGSDYDLYSVMLHETGHALGLDHTSDPSVAMYPSYQGARSGLSAGDIAGIQAIYGARTPDGYQRQGQGVSPRSAVDATTVLDASGQGSLSGVSLYRVGDLEFFSLVAPAGASGGLQVTAAAGGVSLLSPRVSLFDDWGNLIATAADPSSWGNNVTVSASGVTPGRRYYVVVNGATGDEFSVGGYALNVSFTVAPPAPPTPPPPPPVVIAPQPQPTPQAPAPPPPAVVTIAPDRFEPNNSPAQAAWIGLIGQMAVIPALSLDTAADVDDYRFQNYQPGIVFVMAAGTNVRVLDSAGRTVAAGPDFVGFSTSRGFDTWVIQITSSTGAASPAYAVAVLPIPYVQPAPTLGPVVKGRVVAPGRQVVASMDVAPTPIQPSTPAPASTAVAPWAQGWFVVRSRPTVTAVAPWRSGAFRLVPDSIGL